jgi:hypothetical protein
MTSPHAEIDALIRVIEAALEQGGDETKLRRALSLAAEASRTPVSDRRDELVRERARALAGRGDCRPPTSPDIVIARGGFALPRAPIREHNAGAGL